MLRHLTIVAQPLIKLTQEIMIRYCREDLRSNLVVFRISAGMLNCPTGCICDIPVHTKSNLWILSTKTSPCDYNSPKEVRCWVCLPLNPPSCPHDIQEKGKSRRKWKNKRIPCSLSHYWSPN